ncbi:GNAT family N-acetyltransferase [Natrarchaeobius oligotrophus]|uniref:GNAT family N-acetyltransferase n=1 Tax=Natrarchaeobius chitinivorans TaxID=1679083 RepID=A0A3N6PDD4_NATCH|nr:GNAT family N-acetyltransferase [Natrarchaeobius chitinivorans]RQG95015.1 GNAT family N-acetyltransferase [Natrarchaeobius chitinivorans]
MHVRELRGREDVRAIVRLHGRAWREAYDGLVADEILEDRIVDPTDGDVDRWHQQLRENEAGVLVAVDGRDVRGFADFRWNDAETKPFVEPDEAELKAIYVDPDSWGRGYGTALLEAGLERLPASVGVLRLEAFAENDLGASFYRARGFERTGTSTIEIGDRRYPVARYALEIDG